MFFIYFEEINNMNYNKSLLSILIIAIMLCIGISPLKGAEEHLFKKDGKEKKQIVVEEGSESEGEEGSESEGEPTAKRQLTKNKTAAQKRIEAAKKRKEEAAKSRSQKKMTVEKGTSAKKQPTKNKTAAQKRIEAAKKRKEEAAKSRSQKKMTVEKGTSAKKQPTKNKTAAQKRIEAAKKRKEEVAKSRGQKTTGKTTTTVSQNPEKKPEPESSGEESSGEGSESSEEGSESSEEGGGESESEEEIPFQARLDTIKNRVLNNITIGNISQAFFATAINQCNEELTEIWKDIKKAGFGAEDNSGNSARAAIRAVVDVIEKALEDKDIKTATGAKVKVTLPWWN